MFCRSNPSKLCKLLCINCANRCKKESLLFLFLIVIIFSIQKISRYTFEDSRQLLLCVDTNIPAVTPPSADGLIMTPNLRPNQWKSFNATSSNETINRRIFFHETSGRNQLSLQQCCAVESAAKHNPDRPVQLFIRPLKDGCLGDGRQSSSHPSALFHNPPWLDVLSHYPNVAAILLNEDHYFSGTPLQDWYRAGQWLESQHEVAHLSDYIRILTLYKGGGLYLDTDILTLKPYQGDVFRNCLVYGSSRLEVFSNGVMHLERGHWLSAEIVRLLAAEYDPEAYAYHGPALVSEVMGRMCGVVAGNSKTNQCEDVKLLSDRFFYPIEAPFSDAIFNENENKTDVKTLIKIRKAYGLHLWNSLAYVHELVRIDSNQIFSILARQHCPLTVSRASDFLS
ncbi:lactosylceramide 4-alpha-galactosyltransferase [Daphnia magna]|uniref:Alpha 1,4-glycosyltransferase domain-containing protein n=1 Tax=Daphnia magna TaxID=35525 RepID=A0A164VUU0_9CRUS|nr:lactosylceramide 4-alpha-galactosyltransferase [Daphnia magna]KZS12678.1 Uncharacterized protein APZ42_022804 [Daphnia magna]